MDMYSDTEYCDNCGEEVEYVDTCKWCGNIYCEDCGDLGASCCNECLEDEED